MMVHNILTIVSYSSSIVYILCFISYIQDYRRPHNENNQVLKLHWHCKQIVNLKNLKLYII